MSWSWVGPAIGAVGGYLGSRGGGDSTTTTNQVPAELSPLAGGVAQRGLDIGNMPYTPYPFSRTADFNPYQMAGMDQIAGQAQGAQPVLGGAANNISQTLNGDFLGQSNPYTQSMIDRTQGEVQGRMGAGAFGSGSFGNAGVAQQTAQALADSGNSLRYQNYNDERGRQMQALGMAPGIAQAQYMPGQQLMGIGGTMQQQGQNMLDRNYEEFQNAQNFPFRTYDAMLAPFGRNLGGSSTTQGPQSNPAAGLLGGAMLGSRIGQNWGQGSGGGWSSGTGNNNWSNWGGSNNSQFPGGDQWSSP